jgi:hypothetical protein
MRLHREHFTRACIEDSHLLAVNRKRAAFANRNRAERRTVISTP